MAQWYYALGNQQNGPVEIEVLRHLLATGRVSYQDLVWHEEMPNWIEARAVPELAAAQPATPQPIQYTNPTANYAPGLPNHAGLATTALVLACTSILCLPLGPILAPTGLIMGIIARSNMKRDGNEKGIGQAVAAIIVGSIMSGLWMLVLLLVIIGAVS